MITKSSLILVLIAVILLSGCHSQAETETHIEMPKYEATTPFREKLPSRKVMSVRFMPSGILKSAHWKRATYRIFLWMKGN